MLVLYNTRRSSTLRREHRTKPQVERPSEKSLGWVAERSIATVLHTSQQDKRSAVECERVVSSTARCDKRTKPQVERPSEKSFGWVAERSIATVLKTVVGATPPGVRIPPHPPVFWHTCRYRQKARGSAGFFMH